jgi:DNA helicase-2/ATP-dependent DNA helicase PcrA
MSATVINLCPQRQQLLDTDVHLLILGGPGSGKTTIALAKAARIIERSQIARDQTVLFLSFARATVARIAQQMQAQVSKTARAQIEINTYHGFTWNLIRSHGYLITGKKSLRLLPPPAAAARMAGIAVEGRTAEQRRLLDSEGMLAFDLFAPLAAELVERSDRIARLLASSYPVIIVDEFQDTNAEEWKLIKSLGKYCRLIALGDPEQRIYEFRGADPARIGEYVKAFAPAVFDFGTENNRSNGTDIIVFGNDLLTGANQGKAYTNVKVSRYNYDGGEALSCIKYAILAAINRLKGVSENGWSLAVLVNSKRFMLDVSSYLSSASERLNSIYHEALIDPEGPALTAVLIAGLLEGAANQETLTTIIMRDLIEHMRGHNGGNANQADLKLAAAMEEFLRSGKIRGSARTMLLNEVRAIASQRQALSLHGDPEADWLAVRRLLSTAMHPKLQAVAEDAKFLRLLNRGAVLRAGLAEQWRRSGSYEGARGLIEAALLQEHFSASTRTWEGVHLMTIHKSKGKEFDEVIVLEGARIGRLLRENASDRDTDQARLTLRVAATRARTRATILTPKWASCPLL